MHTGALMTLVESGESYFLIVARRLASRDDRLLLSEAVRVMNIQDVSLYRKLAADCVDRAGEALNPEAAEGIMRLCEFWLAKADQVEHSQSFRARILSGTGGEDS